MRSWSPRRGPGPPGGSGGAGRGDVRPVPARRRMTIRGSRLRTGRSGSRPPSRAPASSAGDLTPECAAVVTAVLESLSAPVGAQDTRTQSSATTMRWPRRCAALAGGMLPERAGQPVKAWAHVSLAELRALDDGSALQDQWITEMAVRWAARRAAAADGSGGDGGAWLDGTGRPRSGLRRDPHPGRHRRRGPRGTGSPGPAVRRAGPARAPHRPGRRRRTAGGGGGGPRGGMPAARLAVPGEPAASHHRPGRRAAVGSGGLASFLRTRQLGARLAGPSLPLDIGYSTTIPPGSATRSSCGTGAAAGPAAAPSPRPPARSTTSGTWPTAGRPAWPTACSCAPSTTRSSFTAGAGPDAEPGRDHHRPQPRRLKVLRSHGPPARAG